MWSTCTFQSFAQATQIFGQYSLKFTPYNKKPSGDEFNLWIYSIDVLFLYLSTLEPWKNTRIFLEYRGLSTVADQLIDLLARGVWVFSPFLICCFCFAVYFPPKNIQPAFQTLLLLNDLWPIGGLQSYLQICRRKPRNITENSIRKSKTFLNNSHYRIRRKQCV